jgi:hypothetical protein
MRIDLWADRRRLQSIRFVTSVHFTSKGKRTLRCALPASANQVVCEYSQLFLDLSQHRGQALLQAHGKNLAGQPTLEDFLPAAQLHERVHGIGGVCGT